MRRKDRCRVTFSIDLIERSVAVEVDEADLEAIECRPAVSWYTNALPEIGLLVCSAHLLCTLMYGQTTRRTGPQQRDLSGIEWRNV